MKQEIKDSNITLSIEEAALLIPKKERIHTYRMRGYMLFGADYSRDDVFNLLRQSPQIVVAGRMATEMEHAICVQDHLGWLFIETVAV